jgi:hypothetical protein
VTRGYILLFTSTGDSSSQRFDKFFQFFKGYLIFKKRNREARRYEKTKQEEQKIRKKLWLRVSVIYIQRHSQQLYAGVTADGSLAAEHSAFTQAEGKLVNGIRGGF